MVMEKNKEVLFWFSASRKKAAEERVNSKAYPNARYRPMFIKGQEFTSITDQGERPTDSDCFLVCLGTHDDIG